MGLLKEAVNQSAYVKAGFLGFGGSGKTLTAALLALGLAKLHGKHKAVAMLDTETGSDFLIPIFKREGIKLFVVKSRAFADLLTVFKESHGQVDSLVVDSVTHVWKEVCTAYEKRMKRKYGLSLKDWGPIKEEWQQFTDAYVNASLHAIVCGRAGFDWDYEENEETGRKELIKTGVKMKTEGEFGFEPSLLFEMERVPVAAAMTKDPATHGWLNRAIVLKDRAQVLHGAMHEFGGTKGPVRWEPVLEFVKPHLDALNLGGEHIGVDTTRNSQELFESPDSASERKRQVQILLELIPNALVERGLGGTSAKAKEAQIRLFKGAFGTSSWTAIENMRLEELQTGYAKIVELADLELDLQREGGEPEKPARAKKEPAGAAS